jgi:exportin-1
LFFLGFFRNHLAAVEKPELHPILLEAHYMLVRISQVPDVEVFKITLEYWNLLATDLHHESAFVSNPPSLLLGGSLMAAQSPRRMLYAPVLSKVRAVMVSRMAKPEEVCNGLNRPPTERRRTTTNDYKCFVLLTVF